MRNEALRRGDLVEVRSAAEVLATLDDQGSLEQVPFMPEMAQLCGRRFTVDRRVERVCDTIGFAGSRRMPDAVFLDDPRCDGAGHGGCQAECRVFWKEAWLRKVTPGSEPRQPADDRGARAALAARAARGARPGAAAGDGECWRCQATEMLKGSHPLRVLDPRVFVREYTCGNVSLGRFLRVTARAAVEEPMKKLGLVPDIPIKGKSSTSRNLPPLHLQPGEWVTVKSRAEIEETLNDKGRHRGLWFDREMAMFCGRSFRVRRRVTRILDERTGRVLDLKSDCVTLEGAVCSGEHSLGRWFCARAIYPYWRECWLRRVDAPATRSSPPAT